MFSLDPHIASTFGLLLGMSLLAGLVAELVRLPKVTAYLLVGLLLGPSVADLVPDEHVKGFDPILKLAMSLVLFDLGCHFPFHRIRRIASQVLPLSFGELSATFVLVTLGMLFAGQSAGGSLLLGCLALATAPATTILVLKEFRAQGPVTEYASILVAVNNCVAIVTFELAFLAIQLAQGKLQAPLHAELGLLLRNLGGSVLLGAMAGLLVSYSCGFLRSTRWLVLLLAAATFLLGTCETFHLPYMLTFLVMGMIVANTSDVAAYIAREIDHLTGLLCVLFFAVHGAELDVVKFVAAGAIGGVYIVCRLCGKYFGIRVAASTKGHSLEVQRWLGTALMAQAGAAIALSAIAANRDPELGGQVQTIILGSVIVFEIIGPVLIRLSVLRAGEVPIAQAVHHTTQTPAGQVQAVWRRLREAWGRGAAAEMRSRELTVADLLRKNVKGIHQSASFDEIISYIEHSHDNTYPVVDDRMAVVGLIRYPLLSNVMFDPLVSRLVRAEDLATPADAVLYPDEPASRAYELLQQEAEDCIPVVARDPPSPFLGVVRQADVMHLLIRRHRSEKGAATGSQAAR